MGFAVTHMGFCCEMRAERAPELPWLGALSAGLCVTGGVGHRGAGRAVCAGWLCCDPCVSACSSFLRSCAPPLTLAPCSSCWSVPTRALWMLSVKMKPSKGRAGHCSAWGRTPVLSFGFVLVLAQVCCFSWLMSELFGTVKELQMQERIGGAFWGF